MGPKETHFCRSCTKYVPVHRNDFMISCGRCGNILEEDLFSNEQTFSKGADGQSRADGNLVNTVQNQTSESRERTLGRAYDTISDVAYSLGVGGGDQICLPAKRFYEIALQRNFTRGRRADQVAAACLYLACRERNKPFLLIEFSEILRVNVYVLGAVFLQLCKFLRLDNHTFVQNIVDPSLFIHRFANGLLGEVNHEVERTALRIVTSMKRDWIQTGRKPSGICGAALYIAALSHGLKFSKADVVKIVHICEATLMKRLIEFEGTESGGLTIEEFNKRAEEVQGDCFSIQKSSGKGELLCKHKDLNEPPPHFAHGLCGNCHAEFVTISGGLDGGSEPPAFQRAERERLAKASADENAGDLLHDPAKAIEDETRRLDSGKSEQPGKTGRGSPSLCALASEAGSDYNLEAADSSVTVGGESENFSDIDDAEVDGYLHNEEEKILKKITWEAMNQEYLQEQALKEEAAKRAMAENGNCSAELLAARAAAAKLKKERRQKRASEVKNAGTASEAAYQTLIRKGISKKINYDRVKELLDPVPGNSPKKSKTEVQSEPKQLAQTTIDEAAAGDGSEFEILEEYNGGNNYQDHIDYTYHDDGGYEDFDDGLS